MSGVKEGISLQILQIFKKIIRQYYEYQYLKTDKVDKFLGKYKLLKLKPKEMENLKYSISIKEIEAFLKICSQKYL